MMSMAPMLKAAQADLAAAHVTCKTLVVKVFIQDLHIWTKQDRGMMVVQPTAMVLFQQVAAAQVVLVKGQPVAQQGPAAQDLPVV